MNKIRLYLFALMLLLALPSYCQQMYNRSGSLIGRCSDVPLTIIALVYFFHIIPLS